MTHARYFVGVPRRPEIRHDDGFLDRFRPRSPTPADRRRYAQWQGRLELAEAVQGVPGAPKNDLPDALAAYRHFLTGRGATRFFSDERCVANDASGRTTLRSAILEAMGATYDLLVIHAEDRYNFNPGAADIATGIPDSDNGVFEVTGLANDR